MSDRTPGPMCQLERPINIDDGTMCLAQSPAPRPLQEVCGPNSSDNARAFWLWFFDHYLPRKFLQNYMDACGTKITLTEQEMIDCHPVVDIRKSTEFRKILGSAAANSSQSIDVKGLAIANTNGTLGNFTVRYQGLLMMGVKGEWEFKGQMSFKDTWDFDPKGGGSNRSMSGEFKTRVGTLITGRAFQIDSVEVPVEQTHQQSAAQWAGKDTSVVEDKLMGSDVGKSEVGDASPDVNEF